MNEEIKMICRYCKKEYESDEYKKTGNLMGWCTEECKDKTLQKCKPSTLFPNLVKELNNIAEAEK